MIRIDNKIFDMTTEHIYLYSWLLDNRLKREFRTITSITILAEQIEFVKKIHDNKNRIRQLLIDLAQQEFIELQELQTTGIDYSQKIEITFEGLSRLKKNYTKLSDDLLRLTPRQFHAAVYIQRFSTLKNKRITVSEFAEQMKCSSNTAQNTLNELEQLKIITITRGKYKTLDGRLMQDINQYHIRPYSDWFKDEVDLLEQRII